MTQEGFSAKVSMFQFGAGDVLQGEKIYIGKIVQMQ